MANQFDSTNYPEKEPAELIAGDRWVWKRTDLGTDYPPDSYALSYSARLEGSGATEIGISATEDGSDYLVEVASATTGAYTAGRYHWQAYITRSSDSQRITVDSGIFEVKDNRDSATTDPRTHARIVLDAIETAIESLASKKAKSYTVQGRSMTFADLPELYDMRRKYRAEVRAEERRANGTGGAKVVVRL